MWVPTRRSFQDSGTYLIWGNKIWVCGTYPLQIPSTTRIHNFGPQHVLDAYISWSCMKDFSMNAICMLAHDTVHLKVLVLYLLTYLLVTLINDLLQCDNQIDNSQTTKNTLTLAWFAMMNASCASIDVLPIKQRSRTENWWMSSRAPSVIWTIEAASVNNIEKSNAC